MEALLGLVGVAEALSDPPGLPPPGGGADALLTALRTDERLRGRLVGVLGASTALAHHLRRHPEHWPHLAEMSDVRPTEEDAAGELSAAVGADPKSDVPQATLAGRPAADALRVAYRRALLGLAARDLCGVTISGSGRRRAGRPRRRDAGGRVRHRPGGAPPDATRCRLAVIGMGKAGGRELNYVSDVDVIFVAEPRPGREPAAEQARAGGAADRHHARAGNDAGVLGEHPGGDDLAGGRGVAPRRKGRPARRTPPQPPRLLREMGQDLGVPSPAQGAAVAGDRDSASAYVAAVAAGLEGRRPARGSSRTCRRCAPRRAEHPRAEAIELKLGPGGLRDIEFAVQLLQLVHGRTDPRLRSPTTLTALEALSAARLRRPPRRGPARRGLPLPAHARAPHPAPSAAPYASAAQGQADLRRLGRSMGYRSDPVIELTAAWRAARPGGRRLHEKLFYRPLLAAVARLEDGEARLTPEAARERLEALGYLDPAGALRHIEALDVRGVPPRVHPAHAAR